MPFQVGRKRKLLAELNTLTHSQRVRYMSEYGRDRSGTNELRTLLNSLDGDLHEWQLRIHAARAAGESSDVIEALSSPLRSVRSLAITSLRTLDVDFEIFTSALGDMAAGDRRSLLAGVRQRGDSELANRLIESVNDRFGADEASILVAACDREVCVDWLPRLAHAMASWPSLVRSHPTVFVTFLRDQMSLAPIVRDAWWVRASAGISELIDIDPAAALDLWADLAPTREIPLPIVQKLPRLATEDVDRTITLLLDPKYRTRLPRVVGRLRRRIGRADRTIVAKLAHAVVHDPMAFATVLTALAPSRRADLFDQATADIDTAQLEWQPVVLQALPHFVRHDETRRMLTLPRYRDADAARNELQVWLPIEETWEELLAATNANDAVLRADAYRRLVTAVLASRDRAYFDLLLTELQRMRNEQDPVRNQTLCALSQTPVHLLDLDNFAAIDDLVDFVIEARDSSRQTVGSVTALLQRVLAISATDDGLPLLQRCVDALARLAGQSGQLQLGLLYRNLPREGEFVLFDALEPRLRADVRAGRPDLVFNLARALGPRGHNVPQLERLLAELTRSKSTAHAQRAIQLWLAVPGNRATKLGELIEHDPSTVLVSPVFRLVSLMRQDLLETVLSDRALTGRFAPSAGRRVPMIDGGFTRWNPAQRRVYASLLEAAINNEHTGQMRMGAIRTLARVPELGTDRIRPLTESDDVITAEAALGGLSWGESAGDELTTLLSHANSDRARVAVYSATRAARFATPQLLDRELSRLLAADDSKLIARKEALRMLGQNRTPAAIDTFVDLWDRRPLHRSIAIALASALRNYPDYEHTWQVYHELAAGGPDAAYAVAQSLDPLSWPEKHRYQLAQVGASLARHEAATVRSAAWRTLAVLRPWNDDVSDLLREAIVDLSTITSWRPATSELHRLLDGYPNDPILAEVVNELAQEPMQTSVVEANTRDLPVVQRLEALAAAIPTSAAGKATMRQAAEHLVEAGLAAQAIMYVASGVDWAKTPTTLARLVQLGELHPTVVPRLHPVVSSMLTTGASSGLWEPADLLATGQQLVASSEAAGLVAVAVVGVAGPPTGWAHPWRQLLSQLRSHESVWVQSHAMALRTANE